MKLCSCARTHEVRRFGAKKQDKKQTSTQCLDCGMYTYPCPRGHDIVGGYCIQCGQFSPVLKLREDAIKQTSTDSQIIIHEPIILDMRTEPQR